MSTKVYYDSGMAVRHISCSTLDDPDASDEIKAKCSMVELQEDIVTLGDIEKIEEVEEQVNVTALGYTVQFNKLTGEQITFAPQKAEAEAIQGETE